ncbi:DUF58 domain-containing protein [Candidatus Saccharibacteria bacterium]|nr:DUF58 domain-containing protein [Candidatus Saccharibacteria bacterium]MBR6961656.1 DUF58 domain-containing protein [Candidatus Saccharibacteria bacterium]
MAGYLVKVRKKMNIITQRRVRNVLTGNYGSVFKGRSIDFDDLREYVYGDDIKDIDWKASARSRSIMIRRYVAVRKHNILLVADNGNTMATLAPSGESKQEIATFCAGVMSYIAIHHGDYIGIVYGNKAENKRFALKEDAAYAENFLGKYAKSMQLEGAPSDLNSLLSYVSKTYRERCFLMLITDADGISRVEPDLLRRLHARNEIMVIVVEDSPLTNQLLVSSDTVEIEGKLRLSQYLRKNKRLSKAEKAYRDAQRVGVRKSLRRMGIVCCFVDSVDHAIPRIVTMLEEQKHVRK